MNPKQECDALIEKFEKQITDYCYGEHGEDDVFGKDVAAKQCALICVDIVLNLEPKIGLQQEEFWNEVKSEIENI